jgi:hypothetical protein
MSTTCEFINVAQHMANTSEIISTRKSRKQINFFCLFIIRRFVCFVSVRVLKKKNEKHQTCRFQGKIVEGHEWPQMFYLFCKSKWVGSGG